MRKPRLYRSKDWLKFQHYTKGKSIDEIAKMCDVEPLTIRRQLEHFGIKIAK